MILIGEIRDAETMEHAIAFAETGHLCLGTLHANNANQTIDRIINFFPEERRNQLLMDLSANLRAIISQRLVRKEDGKGRRAAIEILLNTPTIAERIFKGAFGEIKGLMEKSRELGMRTFDWSLFELYNEGEISYEEALRNADSANELRLNMKLKSVRGEPASASGGMSLSIDKSPSPEELEAQRAEEMVRQQQKRRELEEQQLEKLAAGEGQPLQRLTGDRRSASRYFAAATFSVGLSDTWSALLPSQPPPTALYKDTSAANCARLASIRLLCACSRSRCAFSTSNWLL